MAKDPTFRLRSKRERLEAELAALREEERAEAERRHAVAGRAVLDEATRDRTFATQLMAILDRALTKRRERKLFDLPSSEQAEEPLPGAAEPALSPAMS